jgi:addiction module RelB/DinJ family antitoxin
MPHCIRRTFPLVDNRAFLNPFEHMPSTTLFRTRVPTARLRRAEKVFSRLGMKPGDAFNIFLAQVEIRNDMPFSVTTSPDRILSTAEQGKLWEDSLGEY